MNQRLFALLAFLTISTLSFCQGIEFFEGSWKEAIAEAEKQDKIIFVDAYAVWCGPCKRMAKEVFTDAAVGKFYNEHFINVKMDMERGEGLSFRKKYPVSAFPTLFYIDYNGELVQKIRGARPVDGFIELGKEALTKIDRSGQFAEAYEKGDRSPELVLNYITALNKAGKPTLKITNDYLRSQKDLETEQNLRIIFEGATEADSKIFELLIKHKNQIIPLESAEAFEQKVARACEATVEKGIEYQYRDIVDDAIGKMKKYCPSKAEAFQYEAEMSYSMAIGDAKNYTKNCKAYAKKIASDDPEKLSQLAQGLVMNFEEDDYAMKQAEVIAEEASKLGDKFSYHLVYASILLANGKQSAAREAANQSLELAKTEGDTAVRIVERFLQKLDS